ncbi:hypothetical protein B0H63DRAFT_554300 [Podospora didyma]|uniref:Uncharacterized protein n=1 Tax=Podospora didyma TaxID=330526 RepID=A0AAE0U6H5_9PEZI|nr:hypothetical protein B0H63DRAFT_554300 [Podospora didyma]
MPAPSVPCGTEAPKGPCGISFIGGRRPSNTTSNDNRCSNEVISLTEFLCMPKRAIVRAPPPYRSREDLSLSSAPQEMLPTAATLRRASAGEDNIKTRIGKDDNKFDDLPDAPKEPEKTFVTHFSEVDLERQCDVSSGVMAGTRKQRPLRSPFGSVVGLSPFCAAAWDSLLLIACGMVLFFFIIVLVRFLSDITIPA